MHSKIIGFIGGGLLLVMIIIAIFPEQLAPYSPYEQTGGTFEKPSAEHLLGTNDIGQDILSELIYGTRTSLLVGAISTAISVSIGVAVGIISGWYGGKTDRLLTKITTVFMTIPFLPSIIILSAFSKGGVLTMSVILGVMSWTGIALVLRSATMQIKESTYIKMIKGMGAADSYILTRHILRELSVLILYRVITRMKSGILAESSLSFLGLGNPVAKSWGSMIYYAQAKNALLTGAWVWWIIPPGLCICIVSVALMMISYSLEATGDRRTEAAA